jgi:hypothetical protein
MSIVDRASLSFKRKTIKQVLDRLYRDPDFKIFLAWLMAEAGITYSPFFTGLDEILWNESKRHLVMSILNLWREDSSDGFY